jgi:type I restriction enzyme S subunit
MVRYLRAANVKDGRLDLTDVQSMNFTPAEQGTFALRPGDVLVSEGSGSLSSVGASAVWRGELDGMVCFQNTLLRLRPRAGVEGRYLEWWARSAFGSGVFASIASGANIYHLSAERVRALPISLPPLEEQRRIADFLDAEIARINYLMSTRHRHVELTEERWESYLHHELTKVGNESIELRRLGVSVTTGPFGTVFSADQYIHDGIPMINPSHIKNGEVIPDSHHSVSLATAQQLARHRLISGDLIVGRKGDLGRAALIRENQTGWICGSDCIALHSSSDHVRPEYLSYALRSGYIRSQLMARSLAATMPSLNEGTLLSLRMPRVPLAEQGQLVERLHSARGWTTRIVAKMGRQIDLLTERRQALITAAVTGQIDVSTTNGRGIEE